MCVKESADEVVKERERGQATLVRERLLLGQLLLGVRCIQCPTPKVS